MNIAGHVSAAMLSRYPPKRPQPFGRLTTNWERVTRVARSRGPFGNGLVLTPMSDLPESLDPVQLRQIAPDLKRDRLAVRGDLQ